MGNTNLLSILAYDVQYVGPSDWPKIEVVDCYMTKPQGSYKQASIWCVVNHGPQVLTKSV